MNYQRHYDKLIERARTRPLLEDYFEFHHVIPRCMDGMDDPTNLVELLPEEHRIAHLLLAKIYPHNSDLGYAAFLMTMVERYRGRSKNRQYAWVRCAAVEASRERGREQMLKLWDDPEFAAACSTRMQELHKDPVYARARDRQASKTFRKLWDDPVFAGACAERGRETLLERWKDPIFVAAASKRGRETLLKLWEDPVFAAVTAKRSAKQGRKVMLKLWDDPEFAKAVAERSRKKMLERWEDPEYAKAQSERMKERWQEFEFSKVIAENSRKVMRKMVLQKWKDPKFAKMIAEQSRDQMLEQWKDPEYANNQLELLRKRWDDPEFAKLQSERNRVRINTPEFQRARKIGYWKSVAKRSAERVISEHGTHSRYLNDDCRCDDCRSAYSKYRRELKRKRIELASN